MSKLLVGAGKACIDPTPDLLPIDTRFATCEAIYDSMYVRAIAIDNGKERMLLVTYELSDQPVIPDLTVQIADKTGVPEDNIIITVTHNHSSPCDDHFGEEEPFFAEGRAKYKEIELNAGIEASVSAIKTMRPAKYGYGESESFINVCRDAHSSIGYWFEGRDFGEYSDKTLSVIKFTDEDGKLIAALLNHGTHATNIYLMKDFDGKTKLSGNFPGITCRFVEEHYGDGAICMWTSGAAGDQNPIFSHGLQYEYPDGYSTTITYPDGIGYMQMEAMGRWHGADAVRGIDAITSYSENMPLRHLDLDVFLPAQRRITEKSYKQNTKAGNVNFIGLREEPYEPPVLPEHPAVEDDPEHPVTMRMQLAVLGDIAILCTGCELYAEIGKAMKERSPFKKTIIITHTKDYRHVGYVMGDKSAERKVFQHYMNLKPGAGQKVILEGERILFDRLLEI